MQGASFLTHRVKLLLIPCFIKIFMETLETLCRFFSPKIIDIDPYLLNVFENIVWICFLEPQCSVILSMAVCKKMKPATKILV